MSACIMRHDRTVVGSAPLSEVELRALGGVEPGSDVRVMTALGVGWCIYEVWQRV